MGEFRASDKIGRKGLSVPKLAFTSTAYAGSMVYTIPHTTSSWGNASYRIQSHGLIISCQISFFSPRTFCEKWFQSSILMRVTIRYSNKYTTIQGWIDIWSTCQPVQDPISSWYENIFQMFLLSAVFVPLESLDDHQNSEQIALQNPEFMINAELSATVRVTVISHL